MYNIFNDLSSISMGGVSENKSIGPQALDSNV